MKDIELAEHVAANRDYWDTLAEAFVPAGERSWSQAEPTWGIWGLAESELRMLPEDMSGMRAIELGCGTGYVSCWMMRRGAQAVGIDNSANQLATADRLMRLHDQPFELIHGNAEQVPQDDASFDFAISEYGASIWADPYLWIPEAHRLLKPGGELVFLGTHPLAIITVPPSGAPSERTLHSSYFTLYRQDWREVEQDPGGVEFNLPMAGWLKLFRETGFEVLDYLELKAPDDASGTQFSSPAEWSKRWPCEQVWKLRKL